jgi:hypothetical protein
MDQKSPFVDRSSTLAFYDRNEKMAREVMIANEGLNILKEKLAHCFRTEGVNHYVKCKDLREKYFSLCQDRFKGMILPSGTEPANRNVMSLRLSTENK